MYETEIIDNFLPESDFYHLHNRMMSKEFPWYYYDGVVNPDHTNELIDYQLVHVFYHNHKIVSDHFDALNSLLYVLNPTALIRIKANLVPHTSNIVEHGWHRDLDVSCHTAVLYMNTNDGYTVFKDGSKVESVANRFVSFDSSREHSGSTCTNSKVRMVLNINYL